jgi:glycosyltransferase involved in cell wall biosynthesis
MKSVAHVIASSEGGIRRHVRFLAHHPPEEYRCVGIWGPAALAGYFTGIPYHPTSRSSSLRSPSADVVHAHGLRAGMVAWAVRRPPVVLTVHTDIRTQGRTARSGIARALARATARRSEAVVAPSRAAARHFPQARVVAPATERLGPARRSRQEVRAELGTPGERTVVVTVARLHRDKGLETLVEAVRSSPAEGWICGDGPLRAELERRTAGTSVRILGYRDDVADLLGAADVFALPSVGESYGIAVAEAISAGLPVVVSRAGAMDEIAGEAGILVQPGDARGFAEAVSRLVSDPDLRRELGTRAAQRELPDPETLAAELGEVYERVTQR